MTIIVNNNIISLVYTQGSQIRQIWRILRQNCSDDSTEVTEGVTSTQEIFGNKHSFVLTFFTTNTIYVNCKIANLNQTIEIKELYGTTKQEEGKLRSKFTR